MMKKSDIEILLLDDDDFILRLFTRMLENLGYTRIMAFDRGLKALEWMDSLSAGPDVVLLDLNMPEMDGIEFVRKLMERGYAGNLILVSGVDERMLESVARLIQTHKIRILGHLHKPVEPERLASLLEEVTREEPRQAGTKKKVYSEAEVRSAIQNGELLNYYQPKVAVASGRVVGVEALVRWRHPDDGLLRPGLFVDVAEKSGIIGELTTAVVAGALGQARIWQDAGINLRMAINISMDDLNSLDFPDRLAGQAAVAGVSSDNIVLEVTETRLMKNPSASLETLNRLRLKGFNLSIDDFGTGNSTLAQLRDIPFNELKVDKGFVSGAWKNKTLRAIFDTSLELAGHLEMEVVAEGVEDRNDWDFLRNRGCDMAQGYFISPPMPPENFPEWLESARGPSTT